jgi:uroporphyrinogen decarboxylase
MAMKNGPLISPALFREFMMGPLKRVTKVVNQAGIRIVMVDSDGNTDKLNPLWLEANVNFVYPMEVAAGNDPIAYRKMYGKSLLMMGGIDKRALRDGCGKKEIEAEVERVTPLIKEGGFSPAVDHAVPPDVPFENFDYYNNLVKEVCSNI